MVCIQKKGFARQGTTVFLCCVFGLAFGQSTDLNLSYESLWTMPSLPSLPVIPLKLTIENPGSGTIAQVTYSRGADQVRATIELPAQSEKSFVMYVPNNLSRWEQPQVSLVSPRTVTRFDLPISPNAGVVNFAMVGDDIGGLEFMRVTEKVKSAPWAGLSFATMYAKPGEAPTRGAGYLGMRAVILGDGAERLTEAEVAAMKSGVLAGSTLIFIGGAAKPVMNDPRWIDLLPVSVGEVTNGRTLPSLSTYGENVPKDFTVTATNLKPGAREWRDSGGTIAAWRRVGKGAVVYLPYDLFAGDMRNWQGRKGLLFALLKRTRIASSDVSIPGELWSTAFMASGAAPTFAGYGTPAPSLGDDSIFAIEMPPSWKIGLILLGYIVLVVPVNFLILRKFGKGELAWITAPLLAVGFSAAFFSFSGGLYSKGKSKQTTATIFASSLARQAYALGQEEIFVPQGGQYNLNWDGIEAASQPSKEESGMPNSGTDALQMVESGGLEAPKVSLPNLAFRTFDFAQALEWKFAKPGRLTFITGPREGSVQGKVVNTLDQPIRGAQVLVNGFSQTLGDLAPGETRDVNFKITVPAKGVDVTATLAGTIRADMLGSHISAKELGSAYLLWDTDIEVIR